MGHFYNGEPVTLDDGRGVLTLYLNKKYDFYLGFTFTRGPGVELILSEPEGAVRVMTDSASKTCTIVDKVDGYRYRISCNISAGDSGSPVYYADGIVGYMTHTNIFVHVKPIYDAMVRLMKDVLKQQNPSSFNAETPPFRTG